MTNSFFRVRLGCGVPGETREGRGGQGHLAERGGVGLDGGLDGSWFARFLVELRGFYLVLLPVVIWGFESLSHLGLLV